MEKPVIENNKLSTSFKRSPISITAQGFQHNFRSQIGSPAKRTFKDDCHKICYRQVGKNVLKGEIDQGSVNMISPLLTPVYRPF